MIKAINRSIAARHEEDEKGFTLIELLVVILIIGVLAAIAIPAFLSQREGAWEAQVKSDIANAVIAAETYSVNNNGSYLGLTDALLASNGYVATPDVNLSVEGTTPTAGEFILVVTHDAYDTSPTWTFTHSTGVTVKS